MHPPVVHSRNLFNDEQWMKAEEATLLIWKLEACVRKQTWLKFVATEICSLGINIYSETSKRVVYSEYLDTRPRWRNSLSYIYTVLNFVKCLHPNRDLWEVYLPNLLLANM